MTSEDEDDLIESNSSDNNNTPPLSYTQDLLQDDTNESDYLNTNNQTHTFEELFERFVQANSSKSICKSYENVTKLLNIDTDQVFENGYTFPVLSNQTNTTNSRFLNYLQQQQHPKPTRLIYQIMKSKTNYWKANELWKKYDKRASLKDYLLTSKTNASYKDLNVLIIGCGPVGLRLSIECALLGLKCTVIEKRDR